MNYILQRYYRLLQQAACEPLVRRYLLVLCLLVSILGVAGESSAAEMPPASIHTDQLTVKKSSGTVPVVVLWVDVAEGYHVYAHDETAGRPLHVTVETVSPAGLQAEILYPKGTLKPDLLNPKQSVRVLDGKFPVFICPEPSSDGEWPSQLDIQLSMLLCSTTRCIPWDQSLRIVLDSPAVLPDITMFPDTHNAFIASIPAERPLPSSKVEPITTSGGSAALAFLKLVNQDSTVNTDGNSKQRPQVTMAFDKESFSPRPMQQGLEPGTLGPALLFGLLAGLVLNVMPCVLPVLTIKITGLLSLGNSDSIEIRKRRFRRYTLGFAAGILAWFACLAVLMRVAGLAWGGLFQKDSLVFGLMILVFLLALSLFDVFMLPALGTKLGHKKGDPSGLEAFLFGMTVTLLATPCSGPLLGGVLAWAALQTPWVQGAVIMAAGVGMAMPYLLMSLWPGIAGRLPRPGPWMKDMERLAGFFLIGTVIYLLSILPEWQWLGALVTLLITAICAWSLGRWAGLDASKFRRIVVTLSCVACLGGTSLWALTPPQLSGVAWQPFAKEEFFQRLGKEPMLVEFTADWCPTCKVLERTVLSSDTLQSLAERYQLRLIRVDLTHGDPDSEAFLRALDSVSIPLLALFPAGEKALEPLLLRDLFTLNQLESLVKLISNKEQ